jgi:hypothetical protein
MANFLNQMFGKKENPAANYVAPGDPGTLLQVFLSNMPYSTQTQQKERFARVMTNFEFGLFVSMDDIDRYVAQSMSDGFTVWANVDASSAFLYGAGLIQPDDFTRIMEWLRSIAVPGNIIFTGIHNPGEAMKLIEVKV